MRALAFAFGLVSLATCATAPAPAHSSRPACGTTERAQMSMALTAYCASPADRDCRGLARAFAACDQVDWRDAAQISSYRDGLIAMHAPAGAGYWEGAVFQWQRGAWIVAGLVGGDIK